MLHWEVSIRLWDDWGVGGWRDDDVYRVGRNSRLSLQRLILTSPLKGVIYGTNSSQPVNLKGDILAAYSLSLCFTFKLKFGWCKCSLPQRCYLLKQYHHNLQGILLFFCFVFLWEWVEGVFISVRDTLISSPGNNQGYVMIALTMPVHPSLHPTVILLHRYFIEQES